MTDRDEAFREFVVGAQHRLTHLADLLCGDFARAEDLVQLALLKVYLAWPRLTSGNPEAYARTVIVRANIDTWRRWRWAEHSVSTVPERAGEDATNNVARRDLVIRSLAQLTPRERAVLALRYFYDLTENEIAAELNCPPGTVKSVASRALVKLRHDPVLLREAKPS